MAIPISLIAPAAHAWLCAEHQPRVLHAFPNALNLINADGEILSLVNPQLGPGPFSAVLGKPLAFERLAADERVEFSDGNLVIGNWITETSHAKLWNPRPRWELLVPENLAWAEPILADELLCSEIHPAITNHQLPLRQDAASMKIFADSLAGRGPGLTPSGDDVLMGMIHALWAGVTPHEAQEIGGVMAAHAAPVTTSLSGAWLNAAARGEAGGAWHDLIDQVIKKNGAGLRTAAHRILQTGHTSGADALAGFIAQMKTTLH